MDSCSSNLTQFNIYKKRCKAYDCISDLQRFYYKSDICNSFTPNILKFGIDTLSSLCYIKCTISDSTLNRLGGNAMFLIDVLSREPVYMQIINQLERFILIGIMKPNDQIPSVRSLSQELSINPNTIQKAYSELDRRGIIRSVPGKGCFITEDALKILQSVKSSQLEDLSSLIKELKLAGVTKQAIIECIERSYDND